jgi:hypothetical protein
MQRWFFFKNALVFSAFWFSLIFAFLWVFDFLFGEALTVGVYNLSQAFFLAFVVVALRYGYDYLALRKNALENVGWQHWQRKFSRTGEANISKIQWERFLHADPLVSGVHWPTPCEVHFFIRSTFFSRLKAKIGLDNNKVSIEIENPHFLHPGAVSALTLLSLLFRLEKSLTKNT